MSRSAKTENRPGWSAGHALTDQSSFEFTSAGWWQTRRLKKFLERGGRMKCRRVEDFWREDDKLSSECGAGQAETNTFWWVRIHTHSRLKGKFTLKMTPSVFSAQSTRNDPDPLSAERQGRERRNGGATGRRSSAERLHNGLWRHASLAFHAGACDRQRS